MSHSIDEAQLTAYLLGELSPEDAAQVEAQLAVSAALRDELAGLRQTVASLEAALAAQTPPAVPALDRQKLHSLLQSAVVTSHEPTVSAPALLATVPAQPARGSTSRGWLVAAAVLVVGGLVGLSQMESPTGWTHTSREQELRRDIAMLKRQLGYDVDGESLPGSMVRESLGDELKGYAHQSTTDLQQENAQLKANLEAEKSQFLAMLEGQNNKVDAFKSDKQMSAAELSKLVKDRDQLVRQKEAEIAKWQAAYSVNLPEPEIMRDESRRKTPLTADTRARLEQELRELNIQLAKQRGASGPAAQELRETMVLASELHRMKLSSTSSPEVALQKQITGGTSLASSAPHPGNSPGEVSTGPVDRLAATEYDTAVGLERRFAVPTYADGSIPGKTADRYFYRHAPTVGLQYLEKQQSSFGRQVGRFIQDENADYSLVDRFGTEAAGGARGRRGGVAFGYQRDKSQSSARGLQRNEGNRFTTESWSLFADVNTHGNLSQLGDQLSAFVMDGEPQLNQAQDFGLSLSVTPRIIVSPVEESLLTDLDLDLVDESVMLAESKSESEQLRKSEVTGSELPALTVANYENGFFNLGQAVRGWEEFSQQHWSFQRGESLARGTEAAPSARPELKELEDLGQVVAEQTRTLKELREKTPANAEKPLAEVDAKAAQEAQLALVRVSRELNRQQRVWYYREGYVRDLEATIAAAEQYAHVPENDFVTPEAQPLSTFGIDVDTASYSNVRRFVESGQLPPPDAVRIEELINSFQYDGPKVEGEHPLAIAAEVSPCPWQPQHQLLRVALKGKSIDLQQRPPARLVFLVDTSGSMSDANKLPLVKQSLKILVEQMREQDRLSIVTYSDNAGLLLDSTGGDKREAILAAIDGLVSDGSTNGEAGLKLAYEVAVKQFGEGATNRVMLCTDGDFNVGESADSELVKLIEKQRQTGVFLNIFGFGSGNLKDAKLEAIADKGNGQYIYIDGVKEARKTLLNELTGTLYTIAKDVKLQLEFNPNLVGSYRLVGYENRAMAAKDFSNDKVDSGDMGAGHSVVALYEIVPPGSPQPVAPQPETEPLKYKRAGSVSAGSDAEVAAAPASTLTPSPSPGGRGEPEVVGGQPADPAAEAPKPADPLATELCTIRVRYKQPTSNESTKFETVVHDQRLLLGNQAPVSRDHVWATAVAQFGLLTRHSTFVGTGNYSQVLELAQSAIGDDPTGQRREFVTLVRQTQSLSFERERQLAEISRRAEEHRRVVEEIKTVEKAPDVMTKASVSGKYRTLLRRIEVADDQPLYGEFKDWGRWEGVTYKSHNNLPHGYWVYVAPHWYIWGESTERAAVDAAK